MCPEAFNQLYHPVPPYHGMFWPRVLNLYFPRYLRRRYGITKVEIVGAEKLRNSIATGHGVLITPNHCLHLDNGKLLPPGPVSIPPITPTPISTYPRALDLEAQQ